MKFPFPFPRFGAALLVFWLCLCAARAGEITVYAAASLSDAMEEAAREWKAASGSGDAVVCNFAASSTLARQIREGARADIFFSADEAQMETLARAGLIDAQTRRSLLSNTLVIVVHKESSKAALSPEQLATAAIRRLALADPEAVPAGVYARAYLTRLGLWKAVEPKVIPAGNVRAALAAVEAGNADAGIVYKTDAALSGKVVVAFEVPRKEGPAISYPVALLREAPNAADARAFLHFLQSPRGLAIFERFGFLIPDGRDRKE